MKNKLLIITLLVLLISSCKEKKSERDIAVDRINELENQLYGDTVVTDINLKSAGDIIQSYISFADKFSKDSLAPEYLYRAAEISMNLNNGNQAILYFENIKLRYPDFDKKPICLFLQAFIYEDQLGNTEKATDLFNEFMEKYPNHDLYDDAEISVKNMGKSLEEIIQGFNLNEDEEQIK